MAIPDEDAIRVTPAHSVVIRLLHFPMPKERDGFHGNKNSLSAFFVLCIFCILLGPHPFTSATILSNTAGSRTASSESTLRSNSMCLVLRPLMKTE